LIRQNDVKSDLPHILLINPWIHDFAAYDFWAKPLGLLTLASLLRHHGYAVSYIDCLDRFHPRAARTDPFARSGRGPYAKQPIPKPTKLGDVSRTYSRYGIRPEWFREDLRSLKPPDLVFVTSLMTYWYPGVQETISVIRELFPKALVVLGGIYASLCPEHAAEHAGADQVIAGAAEERLLQIVEHHTGVGVAARFDPRDLDTYPYPAMDLQHLINYVPILTTRGCPFECAYCAAHILNPGLRRRSPESVVAEIEYWHKKFQVNDFVLYDDAFLVDPVHHALPVLDAISRSTWRVRFHTPNALHIRGITAETADLLAACGFETLRLGLESTEFEHREGLDRKVTSDEFRRAVAHLKNAGFDGRRIGAYLLVGLPGQSLQSVEDSIRTVKHSDVTPILAYYTPIPQTALWDKAVRRSRYDLPADPIFTNNAVFPCRQEAFSWHDLSRLKQLAATD
jgi:radical SAM superfamily enzyme YgiQ (UPF0313 family)